MTFEREQSRESHGVSVRERCACGAEFEMNDDGWYTRDTEKEGAESGEPMAVKELHHWRTAHPCSMQNGNGDEQKEERSA